MSTPKKPSPAKLVIGFFMNDKSLIEPAAELLIREFGEPDIISEWIPFDFTDYYAPEMGSPLFRRMFAFKALIEQKQLAEIKCFTNGIEARFAHEGRRPMNIDPGYMLPERFVLATGKNFTHRIYLDKGIYADLTLIYQKGAFQILPWTYPDYADERMLKFLTRVRSKCLADLRQLYATNP